MRTPLALTRLVPLLTMLGAVLLAPPQVGAQAPGYQRIDTRQIVAEYNAEVLSHLNRIMADWERAWANDDIETLCDLYWEDAVFIPADGAPLRGGISICDHLASILPTLGAAEAFMLDFDASGGMATVFGNYLVELQTGAAAGTSVSGPLVTVFKREGRTWRIRTQVFVAG